MRTISTVASSTATEAARAGPAARQDRRRFARRLAWLGLLLSAPAAAASGPSVAAPGSPDARLIEASGAGDLAALRRLMAAGADLGARDPQGRTALLAATYANRLAIARVLIDAGADVNAQDAIRNSAFLLAGARGHLEILRMTLAVGADLGSRNRYGGTALIPACHYGHVETVRALLATRIDVDHVNDLGWTALLEAVLLGDGGPAHVEIVRMLLARGARPSLPDRDGVTPLAHARRLGHRGIEALLQGAGAQ